MHFGFVPAAGALALGAARLAGLDLTTAYVAGAVAAAIVTAVLLKVPRSRQTDAGLITFWVVAAAIAIGRGVAPNWLEGLSDEMFVVAALAASVIIFTAILAGLKHRARDRTQSR